jgi:elongation factor Ts
MHVAALAPPCTRREEADPKEVAAQKAAFAEEAKGKPEQIVEKIVGGKLNRWYSEFVFLEQPFVKDDKKSVSEVLKAVSPDLTVARVVRFEVGRN